MFANHLIVENKNEKVLYLYLNYDYEFAILNQQPPDQKRKTIYEKVTDYIKNKKIDFDGTKIFLVVNGIIMSTLFLSDLPYQNLKSEITPKYEYVEYIENFSTPDIELKNIKKENKIEIPNKKEDVVTKTPIKTEILDIEKIEKPKPKEPENVVNKQLVTLHRSNGTIEQIELEDYVTGVVAAEMPALFQTETLKAQAVVARTYALKRISKNETLYDTHTHQSYKDINQLKSYWGSNFDNYYNKIKKAVAATKNEYITYNNNYIDALYHSTNNGKTENAAQVWGDSYSYLISVDSPWDKEAPTYLRETTKDLKIITSLLGIELNDTSDIEIINYTDGNSIDKIKIAGKEFSGKYIRETLGLRSTDFNIEIKNNEVIFTTKGYGHGVGMSQYGANGMAKEGYNYKQIIAHYYPNTKLTN